jgi:iron-sulfur cluster repair protein YtfE (RIC family)
MNGHRTIIDLIQADHELIFDRIAELERRVSGPRDEAREPVLAPLETDLLAHMTAEEEYVYALLEKEMRSWIENSRREHQVIRDHLAARVASGMPPAAWLGRLQEMRRALEAHIAEENRAVLPQFEMTYDLERLRDFGDEYARREREAR